MPRSRLALLAALILSLALAGAGSTAAPWQIFFTDNLDAHTVSPAATPLETALLDALAAATTSIDVALYDFNRASIRDALVAAKARGVTVRVVGDDAAYAEPGFAPSFAALQAAGIPIVLDGPPSGVQCSVFGPRTAAAGCGQPAPRESRTPDPEHPTRNTAPRSPDAVTTSNLMHDKYFVIDGQRVWTGSVNMSDTDLTLNHNNALLVESAALAALYQADFEQMFGGRFGTDKTPSPVTSVAVAGVQAGVYFSPQDNPIARVIAAVGAAQVSIDFAIFYFTHDGLRDALIAAQARGVRIRGLWDSLGAGDPASEDEALCAAGIALKIENTAGKMHHKLMVIDAGLPTAQVITGSLNWTASATSVNNENTLILHDAALADHYAQGFAALWDGIEAPLCAGTFLPLVLNEGGSAPPPLPRVRLTRIVYNPPGDDLAAEAVTLALPGAAAPLALGGWTLADAATNPNTYTFPAVTLAPGAAITVWVKAGTDTATDLFWGRAQPVWSNDGDAASLRDAAGRLVDACAYAGGGVEAQCP